jgi:hypothetical protein
MSTTKDSTAREIASSIGCSMQTVANKAKGLGIKFRGRTGAEHDSLVAALGTVKPRPRGFTVATRRTKGEKQLTLAVCVARHLEESKKLFALVKAEIAEQEKQADGLRSSLDTWRKAAAQLETEQKGFDQELPHE